jgi:ABC-2 type transport system ATP-binding protein
MSSAISLERVSKRYGPKTIIHDMTFSVEKGEIVGFLGPNGAGKTTTMRMISGVTTASSGNVHVMGYDMARDHNVAAAKIGYLPEHPPLYDALEVGQYLRFVAKAKRVPRGEIKSEIERVCNACRLEDVGRREIYKLSKGYRQRVGLAQALLGKPDVLLLDEPTAGLDPGQIQETREVIRKFGADHAVLLSTHILPEVTMICQRVAIINQGRLLAMDSPANLQRVSEQSNLVTFTARAPLDALRQEVLAIDGVSDVVATPSASDPAMLSVECIVQLRDGVEAAIARAVATKWELYRLERRQPSLENIFLRYVATNQPSAAS